MKAIYVNSSGVNYARAIVQGYKLFETRSKNVLQPLIGERVAVIITGRGHARVIGYVTITDRVYVGYNLFRSMYNCHLVPLGSKYDCIPGSGKYCYSLKDPEVCDPYPVPENVVRHGRTWCEW